MKGFLYLLCAALLISGTLLPGHSQQQKPADIFHERRAEIESSVNRALDFLARNQQPGGYYNDGYGRSVGIVSLAGMAFLSAGHLPGQGKYAVNIDRCLDYVLGSQKSNGLLDRGDSGNGLMYAHTIATLFLSECSGMLSHERQQAVEKVLPRATELILRAQAIPKGTENRGGWRYKPDSRDSDLSCSGWALMALRSAKLNGASIPDAAIESAVSYVLRNHDPQSGRFGYTSPHNHSETLTGCGLLCLELCGRHGSQSHYRAGDYILSVMASTANREHEFYGNYYNAQAMFQLGGTHWERYSAWMYGEYLKRQDSSGGWGRGRGAGDAFSTAMVVLSFTVPYRQLPIYQRDETVDEP